VAFVTSFLFFLQLRIADEFKDFEEDAEFRPYRPIPRGLISLKELGVLFVVGGAVQLGLALWLQPKLLYVLLIAWTYLALMSKEFFVREWITKRPITYLWTRMLIMPIVDFYATACQWSPTQGWPTRGLIWFLIVSFFNGIVIEMGRKIRSTDQEEHGVQTYTRLWGTKRAPWVWFSFVALTGLSAGYALVLIHFAQALWVLVALVLIAFILTCYFMQKPTAPMAKNFERLAGLWALVMYLILGLIPMFVLS
jgi:4-hydroxybenzoate polyprenyltransferase